MEILELPAKEIGKGDEGFYRGLIADNPDIIGEGLTFLQDEFTIPFHQGRADLILYSKERLYVIEVKICCYPHEVSTFLNEAVNQTARYVSGMQEFLKRLSINREAKGVLAIFILDSDKMRRYNWDLESEKITDLRQLSNTNYLQKIENFKNKVKAWEISRKRLQHQVARLKTKIKQLEYKKEEAWKEFARLKELPIKSFMDEMKEKGLFMIIRAKGENINKMDSYLGKVVKFYAVESETGFYLDPKLNRNVTAYFYISSKVSNKVISRIRRLGEVSFLKVDGKREEEED